MNGRKIEIFASFGAALETTKQILFRPFDLTKWLTIGFAAFLAGLADGSHGGGSFNFPNGNNWNSPDNKAAAEQLHKLHDQISSWLTVSVVSAIIVVVFILVVLFLWLGSRGRFMFIDCIVRNRGAIAEPWREFRREGNQLFLFQLAASVFFLCLWLVIALPFIIAWQAHSKFPELNLVLIIFLVFAILILIAVAIFWAVILWFMVPVMYRQRNGPVSACREVAKLIGAYPGPFILYVLFVIVLFVAGMMASCFATCLTCCVALLPYVGTVILLPLYVFYYSYTLLFLRQFGPEYDVWASVAAAPPGMPTEPPPLQPPPVS